MKVGKVSWIPLVGSGAILVVVGFVAGRLTSPADSDSTTATGLSAQAEGSRAMLRPGSPDRPGSASDRRVVPFPSSDPLERMRDALGSGDLLDRTRAWLNFIDRLDADEFESVVTAYQSEGVGRDETGLYAMLLAGWAKMDPFAALDFAKEHTSSQFARQTILTTWARSNPDAAIFWAESNHDGDGPNPWMVGVIRGLADDDPMRAGALMASLPYSGERGKALDAVMSGILKQSPDAVREWIAGIDDDRFREIAMARAAGSLAEADPGAHGRLVARQSGRCREPQHRQRDGQVDHPGRSSRHRLFRPTSPRRSAQRRALRPRQFDGHKRPARGGRVSRLACR